MILEIKEEIQLPGTNIILEVGDRIEYIEQAKNCPECGSPILIDVGYCSICKGNLKEEFIESMPKIYQRIGDIEKEWDSWFTNTERNYTDQDAQDWGYTNLEAAIDEAKRELLIKVADAIDTDLVYVTRDM
jgi:hypothetical protein